MAYCKKCGAYIPDGQTACLACGYDESAEGGEYAYAYARSGERRQDTVIDADYIELEEDPIEERAEVEDRRAKRQEYNKTWAELEKRRRAQERAFKNRQQREREAGDDFNFRPDAFGMNYDGKKVADTVNRAAGEVGSKLFSILSYLDAACFISLILGKDEDSRFHARQGLNLFIGAAIGKAVGSMFGMGWIVWLAQVGLSAIGILNAVHGQRVKLPIVGDLFEKKRK